MNPSFAYLAYSPEKERLISMAYSKLFANSSSMEKVQEGLNALTFQNGKAGQLALSSSFLPLSKDFGEGLKGIIVPALLPQFQKALAYVEDGCCPHLYEVCDEHPELYDSYLSILDGIEDSLLLTAKVYIEEDHSPAYAAERLYCHRNTVAYRLSVFEKKTHIKLDSFGSTRFVYELLRRKKMGSEETTSI
jgi:hypothetical protein